MSGSGRRSGEKRENDRGSSEKKESWMRSGKKTESGRGSREKRGKWEGEW